MISKKRQKKEIEPPPPLTEIGKGHPVTVAGTRGTWTFVSINSSDESVNVWGGDRDPNGKRAMRTFTEDRVTVLPAPKPRDDL